MTITRKANNKGDIKHWEEIISHIDRAYVEFHNVFSLAFAGGAITPQGVDVQRKDLFDFIWNGLSSLDISTFKSIDELNSYYSAYINNLDVFIKDYCRNENLTDDAVSQNKIDVLKVFAKIYYALAKQHYILKLFRDGDETSVLLLLLPMVVKESEELEKNSAAIKTTEIEETLGSINMVFNEIVTGLRLKGFGDIETDATLNDLPKSLHVDLTNIRDELNKIPAAEETNSIISRLAEAHKSGNSFEINRCQADLKKITKVTDSVVDRLGEVVSDDLRQQAKNMYSLLQQCDSMDKQLLKLNEHFQQIDVFPLVIQMYGYKDNHLAINNGYAELTTLAKEMEALCGSQSVIDTGLRVGNLKSWGYARDKINDFIPQIVKEIGDFIKPYKNHIKTYQELSLRVDKLNDKKDKIDLLRMMWAARLKKAENAWGKCRDAMYHAQDVLSGHTESNIDYVKSFLSRHKLTMLLGGVGGTGTGVTLSALLFAFELSVTGVLVGSGTLFGVAAAAMVGMGIDHYRHSKSGNDDMPLSRIDRVRVNKSIFADMSFADELMSAESLQDESTLPLQEEVQVKNTSTLTSHSIWSRTSLVDKISNSSESNQSSTIDAHKVFK